MIHSKILLEDLIQGCLHSWGSIQGLKTEYGIEITHEVVKTSMESGGCSDSEGSREAQRDRVSKQACWRSVSFFWRIWYLHYILKKKVVSK